MASNPYEGFMKLVNDIPSLDITKLQASAEEAAKKDKEARRLQDEYLRRIACLTSATAAIEATLGASQVPSESSGRAYRLEGVGADFGAQPGLPKRQTVIFSVRYDVEYADRERGRDAETRLLQGGANNVSSSINNMREAIRLRGGAEYQAGGELHAQFEESMRLMEVVVAQTAHMAHGAFSRTTPLQDVSDMIAQSEGDPHIGPSTHITALMKKHAAFKELELYNPNSYSKTWCDDKGCLGLCSLEDVAQKGKTPVPKPSDRACWKHSYRYHLELAAQTGGYMLQVTCTRTCPCTCLHMHMHMPCCR